MGFHTRRTQGKKRVGHHELSSGNAGFVVRAERKGSRGLGELGPGCKLMGGLLALGQQGLGKRKPFSKHITVASITKQMKTLRELYLMLIKNGSPK